MKLKLSEVIELDAEVNGVPSKFPGLLYEDLDYTIKLNLHRLKGEIDPEVKAYSIVMTDILKKHGTLKNEAIGSYQIAPGSLAAYKADKEKLDAVEKDIDISVLFSVDVTIDTLKEMGKTKGWYPIFNSIIEFEKNKAEAAKEEANTTKKKSPKLNAK